MPPLKGLKDAKPETGAVKATPAGAVAAYLPPSEGPFRCDNCEYYPSEGRCRKPEIIKELGAIPGTKLARVEAAGCCNFYDKKDK